MRFHFVVLLMFLSVAFNATAQEREVYGASVEIMELDDRHATFTSVGIDTDNDKVLLAAEKNLFQKLLYDGVEGFNDDKPLAERKESAVLDAFFHAKYQKEFMGMKTGKSNVTNSLAYRAFVVSSHLDEKPSKNSEGKYQGTATIVVNHATLNTFLRQNKVITDGDTVVIKENVKAKRPNFLERHRQNKQETQQ